MSCINMAICEKPLRDYCAKDAKINSIGQPAGKDFAYLLGVYLGDGTVQHRTENSYRFQLEVIDKDFIDKVYSILPEAHLYERERYKTYYCLYQHSLFFKQFVDDTLCKRVLPVYVDDWDEELKRELIIGLMDSEGWITKRKGGKKSFQMGFACNSSWTYDIYRMLLAMGVSCSEPYLQHNPKSTTICFTINIKSWFNKGLRFNIARKNDRVNEYMNWDSPSTTIRHTS